MFEQANPSTPRTHRTHRTLNFQNVRDTGKHGHTAHVTQTVPARESVSQATTPNTHSSSSVVHHSRHKTAAE